MIVLGADTHKSSHTVAAINIATGQLLDDKTVAVGARGFAALLAWARSLDSERVWALEDCRHVSGVLERFLIVRGERVVRVSTRLMAGTRRASRERGKSDQIDATSVDRAALAAGIQTLPTAALDGPELDLRLLVDHRERLLRMRSALNNTLQWNLHDLWPELKLPGSSLFYAKWSTRIARRLARAEQTMRVRIARDQLRRLRELTHTINTLEAEISELVGAIAPQLLAQPGVGALTAAKLVGEIAGADRFSSDAKLARAAGIAPIPASSGKPNATAWTAAATARSTPPSTASPSPAPAATSARATTSSARKPKADHPRRHPLPQAPHHPRDLAAATRPHPDQNDSLSPDFLTYRDENPWCRAAAIVSGGAPSVAGSGALGLGGRTQTGQAAIAPWAVSPLT